MKYIFYIFLTVIFLYFINGVITAKNYQELCQKHFDKGSISYIECRERMWDGEDTYVVLKDMLSRSSLVR